MLTPEKNVEDQKWQTFPTARDVGGHWIVTFDTADEVILSAAYDDDRAIPEEPNRPVSKWLYGTADAADAACQAAVDAMAELRKLLTPQPNDRTLP